MYAFTFAPVVKEKKAWWHFMTLKKRGKKYWFDCFWFFYWLWLYLLSLPLAVALETEHYIVKYDMFYIKTRCICNNVVFTSASTCDLLQPSALQWKQLHVLLVSTVQAKSLIIRKGRIITGMFLIWHEKRQNTLTLTLLFPGDSYCVQYFIYPASQDMNSLCTVL